MQKDDAVVSAGGGPAPVLTHLRRLTDGTGLLQHARFAVADRRHGYCLDDNARALWLAARLAPGVAPARGATAASADVPGPGEATGLAATWASFVDHAWDRDALGGRGRFRNFMAYDRRWLADGGAIEDEDAQARGTLALAHVAGSGLGRGLADWAGSRLVEALRPPALPLALGSPRAWAAALVACRAIRDTAARDAEGSRASPLAAEAAAHAAEIAPTLARRLLERHRAAAGDRWPWFEDGLAYDNARLCEGALAGAAEEPALLDVGLRSLRWLVGVQCSPEGRFRPYGNAGFGARGRTASPWDQQPLEAWATADAAHLAAELSGDGRWRGEIVRAHAWFLGENDAGAPLVDADGGCADGIGPHGINANRGAESTLAWLHTACTATPSPRTGPTPGSRPHAPHRASRRT